MSQIKVLTLAALGVIVICAAHFLSKVYVASEYKERELTVAPLPVLDNTFPYDVDIVQRSLVKWGVSTAADMETEDESNIRLDGLDNARLGDTQVTLLAIYQQQQSKAVLAFETSREPNKFVNLAEGESSGDIVLSQVGRRDVTLSRGEQQIMLRLFSPDLVSSEE